MIRTVLLAAAFLAAGCIDIVSSDGGPSPPEEGYTATPVRDPAVPGVVLEADIVSNGGKHVITAKARNDGERTYRVETGCGTPWAQQHRDPDGRTFFGQEPQVRCLAFSLGSFDPGSEKSFTATWNETRWNNETGNMEDVAAGLYAWEVSFRVFDGEDETPAGTLRITFEVEVE